MNDCQELQLDQLGIYLEQKAYEEEIPLKGTFELTARCNFNCNMLEYQKILKKTKAMNVFSKR